MKREEQALARQAEAADGRLEAILPSPCRQQAQPCLPRMGEAEFRCSPRNTRVTLEEQIEGYLIRRDDHDPNPSGSHVQTIGQGGHDEIQRIHEQTAQEEPPVR